MESVLGPKNNIGWIRSIWIAISLILLLSTYEYISAGGITLEASARLLADVGILMICYSVTVKNLSEFLFKSPLVDCLYRKELGQVGFGFIFFHATLIISKSSLSLSEALEPYTLISGIFSILAFSLFVVMSLISVPIVREKVGEVIWRKIIRLGLLALLIGFLHGSMKGGLQIWDWDPKVDFLPPLSLLVISLVLSMLIVHVFRQYFLKKVKSVSVNSNKPK